MTCLNSNVSYVENQMQYSKKSLSRNICIF